MGQFTSPEEATDTKVVSPGTEQQQPQPQQPPRGTGLVKPAATMAAATNHVDVPAAVACTFCGKKNVPLMCVCVRRG